MVLGNIWNYPPEPLFDSAARQTLTDVGQPICAGFGFKGRKLSARLAMID
jgi:hypothetical protein